MPDPTPPAVPGPVGTESGRCSCMRCDAPNWPTVGVGGIRIARMTLCPRCGNKRCPGARDHDNPCSGIPESGLRLATEPGFGTMVEFAVATLDDGSEVRMRCLGNRVEVRTWDGTASCNPPPLTVDRVGAHVVDARPVAAAVPAPVGEGDGALAQTLLRLDAEPGHTPDWHLALALVADEHGVTLPP